MHSRSGQCAADQPLHWVSPPLTAGFAGALEMQLEALQDRLQYAQLPRAASAPGHRPGASAAEAAQLRSELAAAQAQNRTLRATAARLSKALAAVMHKSHAADGSGSARGKGGARVGSVQGEAAAEVLQQLSAVESILADM